MNKIPPEAYNRFLGYCHSPPMCNRYSSVLLRLIQCAPFLGSRYNLIWIAGSVNGWKVHLRIKWRIFVDQTRLTFRNRTRGPTLPGRWKSSYESPSDFVNGLITHSVSYWFKWDSSEKLQKGLSEGFHHSFGRINHHHRRYTRIGVTFG